MLSALCVSLLPGSLLFAQTRVMPSQPQGVEIPTGGTVIQHNIPAQQIPVIPPAVGSWAAFQAITPESQAIFDKAMGPQVGTVYTPMCVSMQVVAGKNYRFYCFASTTTNPPQTKNAFVDVSVDPAGNVQEKKITDIERKNLMGGWTEFKPLDDKAKAIFAKTQSPKTPCVPLCVSTQVVAGTNYRFLSVSELKENVINVIYVDLRGNVKETDYTPYQSSGDLQKLLKGEDLKAPQPNTAIPATSQPTATQPITSQPITPQPSGPMLGQPRQQTQPQRVIVPRSR